MGDLSRHTTLIAGVAASVALHGVIALAFDRGTHASTKKDETTDPVTVDIEVAPLPPQADDPEQSRIAGDAKKVSANAKNTAVAVVVPKPQPRPKLEPVKPPPIVKVKPKPKPKPEPKPKITLDAGVPATATPDAGVPAIASADAGSPPVAMTTDAGSGPIATTTDGGVPTDGGSAIATTTPPAKHSRTSANLLGYAPAGAKVTILLRFDRLRGTEWAKRAEAVFQPMPDYRALMGGRANKWATLFDTMVVSSPKPEDHRRTTVATRSKRSGPSMRTFLAGAGTKVSWSASQGGALGRRSPSKLVKRSDKRVFLMPYPGWTVLTPPRSLAGLTQPSSGPLDVRANDALAPAWLRRLPRVEAEAGRTKGPALMVTVRKLPPTLKFGALSLPSPQRATLTMELVASGFLVRGTLVFGKAVDAKEFITKATKTRELLVTSFGGQYALKQVRALNAVKGLSFKQKGHLVTYATSISIADARRAFDFAAVQTKKMFTP